MTNKKIIITPRGNRALVLDEENPLVKVAEYFSRDAKGPMKEVVYGSKGEVVREDDFLNAQESFRYSKIIAGEGPNYKISWRNIK